MRTIERVSEEKVTRPQETTTESRPWIEAAEVLLVTRLVFLEIAFAANWLLAWAHGEAKPGFFNIWLKWDAISFLLIAQHGYTTLLTHPHSTAFFPLLPLMLRGFLALDVPGSIAGLVIAAACSLVAFAYLFRLAEEELGARGGRRAVLYLALFPCAVFLIAGYTEPVFLAGAIPAFYYARKGRWHLVGPPAALAVATRFAGVFLLLGLAVEFMRQRDLTPRQTAKAVLALAVGALPLVAYGAFLYRTRGTPLYYFTDQRLGWQRGFANPIEAFLNTIHHSGSPLQITAAVVGVCFTLWAAHKREWGYAAFMGASLGALMMSTYYLSIPRVLVSLFPITLLLAEHTRERPERHTPLLAAMSALAAAGVVAFTRGLGFY